MNTPYCDGSTYSWIATGIYLGRIEYESSDDDGDNEDMWEDDRMGTMAEFMEYLHNAAALLQMAKIYVDSRREIVCLCGQITYRRMKTEYSNTII